MIGIILGEADTWSKDPNADDIMRMKEKMEALRPPESPQREAMNKWNSAANDAFQFRGRPLIDAAFETLKEILELGEDRCEMCALHGLGHLRHPGVPALVQDYIDRHQDEIRQYPNFLKWLESCRDGTVM